MKEATLSFVNRRRYAKYALLSLLGLICILTATVTQATSSLQYEETIFGPVAIDSPLIQELIKSPLMQRLKGIDQSGPAHYFSDVPEYSRYSHSLGVYALLKRFNAPIEEQAAGLLHDASHTVFSHVAEHLYNKDLRGDSYQDGIHDWYLNKMNVEAILNKYGLNVAKISPKRSEFKALEQNLPDLCADRIEYNLHTAILLGTLSRDEVKEIVSHLRFDKQRWYFTKASQALKIGRVSLKFTEKFWGSAENAALHYWLTKALSRALFLKIISHDDIQFSRDFIVLNKMKISRDKTLQHYLSNCKNVFSTFSMAQGKEISKDEYPKFRGLDPWVKQQGSFRRLSEIDAQYLHEYSAVKKLMAEGLKIIYKE